MASGMAGKVRRSTESDEFDLANYDQVRCDELAKGAFSEPFPLASMVRLSFVVGGGKLVRQKYSDDLPKIFMGSLAAIGYQDDSTASVEAGSGGKFKYQHDTGKNLKFVHVFPKIDGGASQAAAAGGDEEEEEEEEKPFSPQDLLFRSEMKEFEKLVADQLPTYSQKKALLDRIKGRVSQLEQIEQKMTNLQQPTAEEQAIFDDVGADELKEKAKHVSGALQGMAEDGRLTSAEKAAFLEQLEAKFEALSAEIAKAEAENKAKKLQALQQQKEVLQNTQKTVKDGPTATLPPLRHAAELGRLHRKLAELNQIEKASKGHYTMDELKKLGERPDIEEAIGVLETRSRGWFEEEGVFKERLQAAIKAGKAAPKAKSGGGGGYAAAAQKPAASSGGFQTVTGGAKKAKSKAAAPSTRNAFSALS